MTNNGFRQDVNETVFVFDQTSTV